MKKVQVYGADHSPWVQAVLLGLHHAKLPHSLTSLPPFETFHKHGITMPAAQIDNGPWRLESADILHSVGFDAISDEQMALIKSAWQGVSHRTDSTAHFWAGFSLRGERNPSLLKRLANNFLRSFVTLYFFVLIRTMVIFFKIRDPDNFGDQFVPFETLLENSNAPYLSGQSPNTMDFLLFGIIQCHSSVYVPPITALQSDPRLKRIRNWIGAMQLQFKDYDGLYSGIYFAPFSKPPQSSSIVDVTAFWLGALIMLLGFPISLTLIAFLAIRNLRSS